MMSLFIDLEREDNKYFLEIFDDIGCVEATINNRGMPVIIIHSSICGYSNVSVAEDRIIEYFKKRGALIINHGREKASEDYIYYRSITILDTDTGNIIYILVL